ncbi:MAG: glycosyltransferase family 2 protein [Deferribacteres bacterium]|nr:glycosyltransferase family 2 protein [Deferribacteres bacterium]
MSSKISIIMPVLNEAKNLRDTLRRLDLSSNEELIIVDGGSRDETMDIAREFTRRVYKTKTGRASVMNYGARKATGDILLFFHSDCILPDRGFEIIRETLRDSNVAAGAFFLGINHPGFCFRLIELGANLRSRFTSLLYGDQGMFLRKEVFEKVGGFADIPLMEDIEISGRLKKLGKIVFVMPPIKASPRRWLKEGAVYTTLRDWALALSYTVLKVSPETLIKYYKEVR